MSFRFLCSSFLAASRRVALLDSSLSLVTRTSSPSTFALLNRSMSSQKPSDSVPGGARELEIDLDFDELRNIVTSRPDSYMLIDVRQPWEVEERGKLPRSVNLPLPEIEEAMSLPGPEFKKKYGFEKVECTGEDVIVYCCRGYRATEAKQKLRELGLPCVKVFAGFIEYREHGGLVDHRGGDQSPQA